MSTDTNFRHIRNFGDSGPSQQLKFGLMSFLEWGFMNIGAFVNISRPTSGLFGGQFSRLYPTTDRNYASGQLWQAVRANWVWESGLDYSTAPQVTSGVFVNSIFYPSSTVGTYAHRVDYTNGRIVFTNAIATTSRVEASYAYKYVNVIDNDHPWFRMIVMNSLRPDNVDYGASSGDWFLVGNQRIQLPAVVVDVMGNDDLGARQLGDASQWWRPEVGFYIFANNAVDRDMIKDTLLFQKEKLIRLYNRNLIANANDFPLTIGGSLTSGAKTYPQLLSSYYYNDAFFLETKSRKVQAATPTLFSCVVVARMEVAVPPV